MLERKRRLAKRTVLGRVLGRLLREEEGFAMEYIIIVLLVAAAVVALVMVFSGNLRNMMGTVNDTLNAKKPSEVEAAGSGYNDTQGKMAGENRTAKSAGDKLGGDFGSGGGETPAAEGGDGGDGNP